VCGATRAQSASTSRLSKSGAPISRTNGREPFPTFRRHLSATAMPRRHMLPKVSGVIRRPGAPTALDRFILSRPKRRLPSRRSGDPHLAHGVTGVRGGIGSDTRALGRATGFGSGTPGGTAMGPPNTVRVARRPGEVPSSFLRESHGHRAESPIARLPIKNRVGWANSMDRRRGRTATVTVRAEAVMRRAGRPMAG